MSEAALDQTYGLLFVAAIVSSVLYGTGILQFWIYIRKYHSKDALYIQALVIAVMICDTVQQTLVCHAVYEYLVVSIANPAILISVVNTLMIELFFSCAIATLVQQFYCWRIYMIGRSLLLAAAVSLLSWAACIVLTIYSVKAVQLKLFSEVITLEKLSIAANSLSAATDVTISIVLVLLLNSSKTGFKRSTDLINRLMVFTFNTGLPTSVSALLATICISALPNTFLYIFFFLLLGRFYTNSLLVTLNSREYIKSSSHHASGEQYSLDESGRRSGRMPQLDQPTREQITIRIDKDTLQHSQFPGEDLKSAH